MERAREKDRERQRKTEKETERDTKREKQRERQRECERERERDRDHTRLITITKSQSQNTNCQLTHVFGIAKEGSHSNIKRTTSR